MTEKYPVNDFVIGEIIEALRTAALEDIEPDLKGIQVWKQAFGNLTGMEPRDDLPRRIHATVGEGINLTRALAARIMRRPPNFNIEKPLVHLLEQLGKLDPEASLWTPGQGVVEPRPLPAEWTPKAYEARTDANEALTRYAAWLKLAELALRLPAIAGKPNSLGITLDEVEWKATRAGKSAEFAGKAYPWNIFLLLCRNHPKITSHEQLQNLDQAWRAVNVQPHMTTIRKLIGPLGLKVKSVRMIGYRLEEAPARQPK
jgi:hypothetical protein